MHVFERPVPADNPVPLSCDWHELALTRSPERNLRVPLAFCESRCRVVRPRGWLYPRMVD
jgi:hypothetical protein